MEDDLEIEIAEVLSGLKQQHPHRSKIQDESENPLLSSEVKGMMCTLVRSHPVSDCNIYLFMYIYRCLILQI